MNRNESSNTVVEVFLMQAKAGITQENLSEDQKWHLNNALTGYSIQEVEEFFRLGLTEAIAILQSLVIDLIGTATKLELMRSMKSDTAESKVRKQKRETRMQSIILEIKKILCRPWDKPLKDILTFSTSTLMQNYGKSLNLPPEKTDGLIKKIGLGAKIGGLVVGVGLAVAGVLVCPALLYGGFALLIFGIGVFVALNREKSPQKFTGKSVKSAYSDKNLSESNKSSLKSTRAKSSAMNDQTEYNRFTSEVEISYNVMDKSSFEEEGSRKIIKD